MIRKPSPEDLKLNEQINAVLDSMSTVDPESSQYEQLCKRLSELNELRKSNKRTHRISPDVAISSGASILGILIMVGYEHGHAFTSQGLKLLKTVK